MLKALILVNMMAIQNGFYFTIKTDDYIIEAKQKMSQNLHKLILYNIEAFMILQLTRVNTIPSAFQYLSNCEINPSKQLSFIYRKSKTTKMVRMSYIYYINNILFSNGTLLSQPTQSNGQIMNIDIQTDNNNGNTYFMKYLSQIYQLDNGIYSRYPKCGSLSGLSEKLLCNPNCQIKTPKFVIQESKQWKEVSNEYEIVNDQRVLVKFKKQKSMNINCQFLKEIQLSSFNLTPLLKNTTNNIKINVRLIQQVNKEFVFEIILQNLNKQEQIIELQVLENNIPKSQLLLVQSLGQIRVIKKIKNIKQTKIVLKKPNVSFKNDQKILQGQIKLIEKARLIVIVILFLVFNFINCCWIKSKLTLLSKDKLIIKIQSDNINIQQHQRSNNKQTQRHSSNIQQNKQKEQEEDQNSIELRIQQLRKNGQLKKQNHEDSIQLN